MSKWSGSDFVGPTENSWPQGVGKFKFPNGVVYEGQFDKGEFHGDGTLHYPNGVSTNKHGGSFIISNPRQAHVYWQRWNDSWSC